MSNQISVTKELKKQIESGAFKGQYLVYGRRSTNDAENQKNSLTYQKTENQRFAHDNKLSIAPLTIQGFCTNGFIAEKHTAFKEDDFLNISTSGRVEFQIERPKFQMLVSLLNQGYFKGIICLCWDRVSRNKADNTILDKLMNKGVRLHFVTASYDNSSAGLLHMDIDGMFSQHHSRVTSEKVKLTIKNNRSRGKCTYKAPIGYLNEGNWDYKPFDSERAPLVKKLFTMYASGKWSIRDLVTFANERGLTTSPARRKRTKEEQLDENFDVTKLEKTTRPLGTGAISRILKNPFYIGKIIGVDGFYVNSTSHKPLISEQLFNEVQLLLKEKRISTSHSSKIEYPLRGFIRCGECRRIYTPYRKKGTMYYGSACRPDCMNSLKNINLDFVFTKLEEAVGEIVFSKKEIELLDASMSTEIALLESRRRASISNVERKKKTLRDNLAYLRTERISLLKSGLYTPEKLMSEENELDAKLATLQYNEQISDEAMRDFYEDVKKLSELVKMANTLVKTATEQEKEKIARSLFSELLVTENVASFKAHLGLQPLFSKSVALCGLNAWLSEFCTDHAQVKSIIKSLSGGVR